MADAVGLADLADRMADRVIDKLNASVIPSSFPARVGEWLREVAKNSVYFYRGVIPLCGPNGIIMDWRINPDGTINLELQEMNGCAFWHGTFRPAEASRAHP
jgi:hypothetical protein